MRFTKLMKFPALLPVVFLALRAFALRAHDMWLEAEPYFVKSDQDLRIRLGNGSIFQKSENAVAPDRLTRFEVRGPDGSLEKISEPRIEGNWVTQVLSPKASGNYWAYTATRPRLISMSAADFNGYLEHDGVLDVLEERENQAILDRDEVEQYSKYVKAYYQVGDAESDNYALPLGLEIELIPKSHPYRLKPGDSFTVTALFKGKPLDGLWLHGASEGSKPVSQITGNGGQATFEIHSAGRWFIRGIHLFEVGAEDHSYESYWTSLTFAVR